MLNRLKLKSKIIVCLGAALLPVVGLGAVALDRALDETEVVGDSYQRRASGIAETIDRFFFERYGDAQAFTSNDALQDESVWYERTPAKNSISTAMDEYMPLYGVYELMIAVDLEGRVIAASSVDAKGRQLNTSALFDKNFRGEAWFQSAASGRFTTSMPYAAPGNNTATGTVMSEPYFAEEVKLAVPGADGFTVSFAAPFKNADGAVAGIWINYLDMETVHAVVASKLGTLKEEGIDSTVGAILDPAGKPVIYFEDGAEPAGFTHLQASPLDLSKDVLRDSLAGKDGHGSAQTADKRRQLYVGAAHSRGALGFPGTNWTVVFGGDEGQALAGARAMIWAVGVAFALCVAAIVGAVWALLKQIADPLRAMTAAARELGQGDVEQRIDHHSPDEIGDLAEALRGVTTFVKQSAEATSALAVGDFSKGATARSDKDVLAASVDRAQRSMNGLVDEMNRMIQSAKAGELSTRADTHGHAGVYLSLVTGLNELMASCQAPITEAQSVLARVAERDLMVRMKGQYAGDWDGASSAES